LSDRLKDALSTTTQSGSDDLADVDRVLAGDVGAFEGIVRRWQGPLVNMAWRYCRDRGRAEELAQEALARAGAMAAGGEFFNLAVCAGGERVSE
jgi:hypothetical protein